MAAADDAPELGDYTPPTTVSKYTAAHDQDDESLQRLLEDTEDIAEFLQEPPASLTFELAAFADALYPGCFGWDVTYVAYLRHTTLRAVRARRLDRHSRSRRVYEELYTSAERHFHKIVAHDDVARRTLQRYVLGAAAWSGDYVRSVLSLSGRSETTRGGAEAGGGAAAHDTDDRAAVLNPLKRRLRLVVPQTDTEYEALLRALLTEDDVLLDKRRTQLAAVRSEQTDPRLVYDRQLRLRHERACPLGGFLPVAEFQRRYQNAQRVVREALTAFVPFVRASVREAFGVDAFEHALGVFDPEEPPALCVLRPLVKDLRRLRQTLAFPSTSAARTLLAHAEAEMMTAAS